MNGYSDNAILNVELDSTAIYKRDNAPQWTVETRRYLQFGELVFDGKRTVENYSTSFNNVLQTYLDGFGSFDMHQGHTQRTQTTSLSITVEFGFNKLSRLEQRNVVNHIKSSLLGTKRLWAVEPGGQIIWTWAKMSNYSEPEEKADSIFSVSLEFQIPSGCWFIADLAKVYVQEYDRCDFLYDIGGGCENNCLDKLVADGEECDTCKALEHALSEDQLFINTPTNLYWNCQADMQLVYSNLSMNDADNLFANYTLCFRQAEGSVLAGRFCSDTVLEGAIQCAFFGKYENPTITVNDDTIAIRGTYDGLILIDEDGNIGYYAGATETSICDYEPVDLDLIDYCSDRFRINAGQNTFAVTGTPVDRLGNYVFINRIERTY